MTYETSDFSILLNYLENELNSTIDVTNINEKIYDWLKKRIINCTYPPGHKLNVRQLRKDLGVSQTPIKDALFRLAGEGLIEISSRKGTYVKEVTDQDIAEIYDTRLILESGAGEIIAKRITDEQIKELEGFYKATLRTDADADYRIFMERESEFHLAIMRYTNNSKLISIYKQLNAHMQSVRFSYGGRVKRLPNTNQEHENILKALKKRDPVKAKEAIKNHLLSGRATFLEKYTDINSKPKEPSNLTTELI